MSKQTTIQNQNAIFPFDGYKVEIGETIGALTDVGSCEGDVTALVKWTKFKYDDANTGTIIDQAKDMSADLKFIMNELSIANLVNVGSGIFTQVDVAGTPVAVTGEALGTGWTVGQPIKLANKNGANTIVASITIDAGGSPLVDGTNYNTYVGDGSNGTLGYTYIVPITANALVLDADYTYTPNESTTLAAGGASVTLTPKIVKFSNVNSSLQERSLTFYSSTLADGGFNFTFGSAINEGIENMEVMMTGGLDPDRTDGSQLLAYLDEQSV